MFTMTPALPPSPAPNGHEAFFALLALMADPDGAKKRTQEILDACLKANEAIRTANEAHQELDAARKLHDETLARERTEHAKKITQANSELASKDQQLNSQLAERERAVKRLEEKTATDAQRVSELQADLERRLETIRQAVTAAA